MRREADGSRHPNTLNALSLFAQVLQDHGELEEAEPLAREAYASWRQVVGKFHADTLVATSNLAQLLTARGKHDEAGPLAREAMEVRCASKMTADGGASRGMPLSQRWRSQRALYGSCFW